VIQSVEVPLTSAITDFGKEISRVVISREMNGADWEAIDGLGKAAKTLCLIERMCGNPDSLTKDGQAQPLSPRAVRQLTMRDIATIGEALVPFIGQDQSDET
jgi:hypothetical protein